MHAHRQQAQLSCKELSLLPVTMVAVETVDTREGKEMRRAREGQAKPSAKGGGSLVLCFISAKWDPQIKAQTEPRTSSVYDFF